MGSAFGMNYDMIYVGAPFGPCSGTGQRLTKRSRLW